MSCSIAYLWYHVKFLKAISVGFAMFLQIIYKLANATMVESLRMSRKIPRCQPYSYTLTFEEKRREKSGVANWAWRKRHLNITKNLHIQMSVLDDFQEDTASMKKRLGILLRAKGNPSRTGEADRRCMGRAWGQGRAGGRVGLQHLS